MSEESNHLSASSRTARIIKTAISVGLGQGVNVLGTLGLVPIILYGWGKHLSGEWQFLAGFPAYLTVADLGLGFALGNELAMLGVSGERSRAAVIYRSAWALLCGITFAVLIIAIVSTPLIPYQTVLHVQTIRQADCALIIDLFVGQILLNQHMGVFKAALRAEAKHYVANYIVSGIQIGNFFGVAGVALFHGPPLLAAELYFLSNLLGAAATLGASIIYVPYLRLGLRNLDFSSVKQLIIPGLSTNLLSLSNAVSLSGTALVIESLLGPDVLIVFTTMRTLARFVNQATNLVEMVFGPELSIAVGAKKMELARLLHHRASQLSVWSGIAFSVLIAVIGPPFYHLWGKSLQFDYPVFLMLLLTQVANGGYYASYGVPMAINKHTQSAIVGLCIYLTGLPFCYILVRSLGLFGASIESVLAEVALGLYMVPYACRLIGDKISDWAPATFSLNFRWVSRRRESLITLDEVSAEQIEESLEKDPLVYVENQTPR